MPVVILHWNAATGEMARRSDKEDPTLRGQVMDLAGANTDGEMCAGINSLLAAPDEARNVCELDYVNWYLGMPS
jgi:hypothetical protein